MRLRTLFAEINANRKWTNKRHVAMALHRKTFPLYARFNSGFHGFKEIVAVRLNVEANQVGTKEAIQKFTLPGTNSEGLRIGPWDVPENGDACIGTCVLKHARQKREMIVLNQNQRLFHTFHLGQCSVRKFAVRSLIGLPIRRSKNGACVRDVAKRPE